MSSKTFGDGGGGLRAGNRGLLGARRGRRSGFTLVELLTTVAALIILLGLMVSLARHVRSSSAEALTKDILRKLDEAMTVYASRNDGGLPAVTPLLVAGQTAPTEQVLQRNAERNDEAFIRALRAEGLLNGRFEDLSVAYYNNARILDAWGSPIVFISQLQPDLGLNVRGWFFFSAGPDRQYLTRDDNLYSYEQPVAQP